jgi:integrase/recombinase XerD
MVKTFPVPCTKEEINALIEASQESEYYYTLFMLAKTTGRRLGEYYSLRVGDIDFEKKVMVTEILKRRQRVRKEALLRDDIIPLLKRFIVRSRLKPEDFVFHEVGYRQIQNAVPKYAKAAGITHKVSFHNFRHYFITELVKQGWHYDRIAKLTGHSTPATILSYDHALATDIREEADIAIKDI